MAGEAVVEWTECCGQNAVDRMLRKHKDPYSVRGVMKHLIFSNTTTSVNGNILSTPWWHMYVQVRT